MYIRQYKYVYLYTYIAYTHTVYLKDAPEPNNITCFFFQIFPYGHDPFAGCNTHTHILLTRIQTNKFSSSRQHSELLCPDAIGANEINR